ncbi:hypothetical protein Enr10x_11940 [Gimesia panareensis]|uniref:3-keto-alpha-glucoside-1,2-lyase/3-keto-2-hydroxy-glucal hydratase domain-containing protein n=2 Tax=Gimesia panareensis TaxID=2527978 RepID=A0A517Q2Q0_9PLAN|nr:DUF1080 domain-containing protein [Gimesia panareensis]QDT25896.1 hypothetical protein Enr10x_11940 [Gimesia panareensis]QDU48833.1 hypothetical protein Pan110_11490 [Gimesia panareensis]
MVAVSFLWGAELAWAQSSTPAAPAGNEKKAPVPEKKAPPAPQSLPGPEKLLNGGNFWDHWKFVSEEAKEANRNVTWKVVSGVKDQPSVLICSGKPYGYIRTQKSYENFQFSMEWMYPSDPNANSGILLFTTEPDKVWPKAFQVQLHRPEAGYVFPTPGSGAKSANKLSPTTPLDLPVGKWHKCVLTCRSGNISVMINGLKLGEVTGCDPSKGAIALQSEGSEIHFRNLVVEVLAPAPAPESPTKPKKDGES